MIEHHCTGLCHVQLTNMDLVNVARVVTDSKEALFATAKKKKKYFLH